MPDTWDPVIYRERAKAWREKAATPRLSTGRPLLISMGAVCADARQQCWSPTAAPASHPAT
jgi:hypothetical protein